MRHLLKTNSQLGTLLLDSLTAIAILAIVFAVSYPNYARARLQASIGVDAQQLDSINTAVTLYANEHKGAYPPPGAVTLTNPGSAYLSVVPTSPISTQFPYILGSQPQAPALYVVVDDNAIVDTDDNAAPFRYGAPGDANLLGNYKTAAGAPCGTDSVYLAEDSVHGIYCTANQSG